MSRLKQRIEKLYRGTFDSVVRRRDVPPEEMAAYDTWFTEHMLRATHAAEYGHYETPWTDARRLDLLNAFRRASELPTLSALPADWPADDDEFEADVLSLFGAAEQRYQAEDFKP
jgi:hypothetical protein